MSGVRIFFSQYLQNVDVPIKTHMNITAVSIKWYFVTYGTGVKYSESYICLDFQ